MLKLSKDFASFSDGEVTVNYEISNGHTVVVGEEPIHEENIKTTEDGSSRTAKVACPEERKEGRKGNLM